MCFARTLQALERLDTLIRDELDFETYSHGCHVISEIARQALDSSLGWTSTLELVGLWKASMEQWIPHYRPTPPARSDCSGSSTWH